MTMLFELLNDSSKDWWEGCPRDVSVKAMDCGIVVSEFVLQSRYYVQFLDKYPWERYNDRIFPAMG